MTESRRTNVFATARDPRRARLVCRRDLTTTLGIFRFEFRRGVPRFEPGQFITLGLRHASGETLWRECWIASAPENQRHLELYLRLSGRFTSELWRTRLGTRVLLKPSRAPSVIAEHLPDGSADDRRLLLVAGGTGLAPFISYALHLRHENSQREIVLCHGARNVAELGYRELLLDLEAWSRADSRGGWRFRYLPTISGPSEDSNTGWTGHIGRVETLLTGQETNGSCEDGPSPIETAIGECLDPANTCIHVCGPDGVVRSVMAAVKPLGFRPRGDSEVGAVPSLHFESCW